jgi:hypothetical protein
MGYQQERDQALPPLGTRVQLGGLLAPHVYGAIGTVVRHGGGLGAIIVEYPHNVTGTRRQVQVYRGEYRVV